MSALHPLDERLIKALAHPLRWRILEALIDRGEASPSELASALDERLAVVSHHTRVLRDNDCIELTRTEPRRGALEHFYRARVLPFLPDEEWTRLPVALRRGLAAQTFRRIFHDAAASGAAGGFDGAEAHLDRTLLELDERGWRELSELLSGVMREAQAIQDAADARRREGADVRLSELSILHFELEESIAAAAPSGRRRARSPRLPSSNRR
jgi:DNA-binding transcriptional ArsR family regulator